MTRYPQTMDPNIAPPYCLWDSHAAPVVDGLTNLCLSLVLDVHPICQEDVAVPMLPMLQRSLHNGRYSAIHVILGAVMLEKCEIGTSESVSESQGNDM
jgi:hypothetical protein